MNYSAYKNLVNSLTFGKKLPDAIYIHHSYLDRTPLELQRFISGVVATHGCDFDWNILKLNRRDFRITLLSYPRFDEDSYPSLRASLTIDLVREIVRLTNFSNSDNPPILHRKETLVPKTYPKFELFRELTEEGDRAGLYESRHRIGFKKSWQKMLAQKGCELVNGRVVSRTDGARAVATQPAIDIEILRHLTAVDRDRLSTPMQSLARHGYLDGDHSLLDFGCGKGHDLLELQAHGLDAVGWDPAFRPDGHKRPSDIVNLGFIINVIEDRAERVSTLLEAYALAQKLLVVAVMIGGEAITRKFREYKDGVVTSRGTFQKYYTQAEIRNFIESALDIESVPVGAGLFYVFKDELEEQEFLARRQRVRRRWKHLVQRDKTRPTIDHDMMFGNNQDLFKDFWRTTLDLGRAPANDEFERSTEIRRVIGSHKKALAASIEYFGEEEYEAARLGRKKDLTVFLALSFFDRHRAYARMPLSLQRDIRNFFGKPSNAYEFAKSSLFSIAEDELIAQACRNAFKKLGCGRLEKSGALTVRSDLLANLPPLLRIYVGCALQLYGDIDDIDLIKIHIGSGKVTLLTYDNFDNPIPLLKRRVKIRMKDQDIDVFPYSLTNEPQALYQKSDFLCPSDPNFRKQLRIDKVQLQTKLDFSGYGPKYAEFCKRMSALNLAFSG